MNMNDLAAFVAKVEGGKKQISIAQVKEVLKIVSIMCAKDSEVIAILIQSGRKCKKK